MPHKDTGKNKKKKLPSLKGKPFEVRGRIWLDGKKGTFLGCGRVVLMERIKKFGSISKAAKSLEMSYRHAWRLIDSMNKQSPHPFVITATGGKKGGGAMVTAHGERAIDLFWDINQEFSEFLKRKTNMISFDVEAT